MHQQLHAKCCWGWRRVDHVWNSVRNHVFSQCNKLPKRIQWPVLFPSYGQSPEKSWKPVDLYFPLEWNSLCNFLSYTCIQWFLACMVLSSQNLFATCGTTHWIGERSKFWLETSMTWDVQFGGFTQQDQPSGSWGLRHAQTIYPPVSSKWLGNPRTKWALNRGNHRTKSEFSSNLCLITRG